MRYLSWIPVIILMPLFYAGIFGAAVMLPYHLFLGLGGGLVLTLAGVEWDAAYVVGFVAMGIGYVYGLFSVVHSARKDLA